MEMDIDTEFAHFRFVASEWHSGMFSAMYAFSSAGTVVPGLHREIYALALPAARIHHPEDVEVLTEFLAFAEREEPTEEDM